MNNDGDNGDYDDDNNYTTTTKGLIITTPFYIALPSNLSPNCPERFSQSIPSEKRHLVTLHYCIFCTGSLFTPWYIKKLPHSPKMLNPHNLPTILPPCWTIMCQTEIFDHQTHCFFLAMACSFPLCQANIWNKLPITTKSACTPFSSFNTHFKTHCFQYTSWLVTWPHASDS